MNRDPVTCAMCDGWSLHGMAKEQAAQGNGYCWHRDQLQYGLERHCVLFTDDRDNRTRRINWIRDFESRESAHQGELNNET